MNRPFVLRPWQRLSPLAAAAAACALTGLSAPAHADSATADVWVVAPAQIAVRSNGVAYTIVDQALVTLGVSMTVNIDAGAVGTVKSWFAYPVVRALHAKPGLGFVHWSNDKVSGSFPFGQRPNSWGSRVQLQVSSATLSNYVVAWCNVLAEDLRKSGLNNAQIFGQDRSYGVAMGGAAHGEFTGPGGTTAPPEVQSWGTVPKFNVVCKASGGINPGLGPVGDGFTPAPQARLTSMTMDVLHNPSPPSCPTPANVRTTYVSDRAGPFSTRVLSASGRVSQPLMFTMGEADRQGSLYIKVHQQQMMVGQPNDPTRTPTGGVVGGQAIGGGFAPNPGPINPNDLPPSGTGRPGGSAPGGLATPTSPGLIQDSLWAEVLNAAPGSVQRTDYAAYQVRCPAVQGPAAPGVGGLASPQLPPSPTTTRP